MKQIAINRKFFIYCNGEVAEPKYFKEYKDNLRARTIIVDSSFKRSSPWDLITKVIGEKRRLSKARRFYDEDGDQCWCVFDIDDYWDENSRKFKNAVKLAKENGIYLAWSNECFELWYLLHFQPLKTDVSRSDYHTKLEAHFRKLKGKPYTKNCSVFDRIFSMQADAIKHAKQIYHAGVVENNPSTSVFSLVEEINKYFC